MFMSGVLCVALDHLDGLIILHALYGMFLASSSLSSCDVSNSPLGFQIIRTPWKMTRVLPLAGKRLKMLGPKGLSTASQYFQTISTVGRPARVSMKLDESGLHHRLERMVMGGSASPVCWHKEDSIALMRVYTFPLNGFLNSTAPVP